MRTHPKLGFSDLALQLWRALPLMMLVAIPIIIAGYFFLIKPMSKTYTAYSRVQVALGQEYVYDPILGDAGRGMSLDNEAVVQTELEKAYSPVIARRVLEQIGLERMYPKLNEGLGEADSIAEKAKIRQSALKALESNFSVDSAPKSPVMRLEFEHKDPDMAAEITNAFLDQYLKYRIEVSQSSDHDAITLQTTKLKGELSDAETAIQVFLETHQIGDFFAEKAAVAALHTQINDQLFQAEAAAEEAKGRVRTNNELLANTNPEIDLYVETNGEQQLLALKIEREQLLSRYRPQSQPVRDLDARIANLEALLNGESGGVRRRGPNPTYQELQSKVSTASADLDAANARSAALRGQLVEVQARQTELNTWEPEYQSLVRDRDVLAESVRMLSTRAQTKQAEAAIAAQSQGTVTVIDRAYPPLSGSSMKLPAAFATFVFACFSAFCAGLAYALTRRTLATPSSVTKTLELPVIGVVPRVS